MCLLSFGQTSQWLPTSSCDGVLGPDQLGAGGFDGEENAELVRAEVVIGWSGIVLSEVD